MNTSAKTILADLDDDVLMSLVNHCPSTSAIVEFDLQRALKKNSETLAFNDFKVLAHKEAADRCLLEPIPDDPKASYMPSDHLEPSDIALDQKTASKASGSKKKAKPVEPQQPLKDVLAQRLVKMDDDLLLACISVFISFPASSTDMYLPGIKMKEWEEACWDEALARNLDDELEALELLKKQQAEELEMVA